MNRPNFLRRVDAAQHVRETWGQSCSPKWLAKLAVVGGGPIYRKAGRTPLHARRSRCGQTIGIGVRRHSTLVLAEECSAIGQVRGTRALIPGSRDERRRPGQLRRTQLELFGFAMSDAVQKTVAPKKKQGGNVVVSSLDRTKGVTSRKVTVASRESGPPQPAPRKSWALRDNRAGPDSRSDARKGQGTQDRLRNRFGAVRNSWSEP